MLDVSSSILYCQIEEQIQRGVLNPNALFRLSVAL